MYSLNMPVSAIRTKIRQEFEQHRYVNQLSVVDVLIQKSNAEFQVSQELFFNPSIEEGGCYGDADVGNHISHYRRVIWDYFLISMASLYLLLLVLREISLRALTDMYKQETLNYWKQLSHVMKYFRPEEDPTARLPPNFISGFLEGRN